MSLFTKQERSTFKYWFAHWCAFQMVALVKKLWKPKYLFHDIEKPWLKLFWDYKKVQKFHRNHSNHHLEYYIRKPNKFDFYAFCIDMECGRYTKESSPLTAREYIGLEKEKLLKLLDGDEDNFKYIYFCAKSSLVIDNYF